MEIKTITVNGILQHMDDIGTKKNRRAYKDCGASSDVFGVDYHTLKAMAKQIGVNQDFGWALWRTEYIEAKMIATMIMDPLLLFQSDLEKMVSDIPFYLIVDELVYNLVLKTVFSDILCQQWILSLNQIIQRASWLIIQNKIINRNYFDLDLDTILLTYELQIHDSNYFKQEAMTKAIAEIACRKPDFTEKCLEMCKRIGRVDGGITKEYVTGADYGYPFSVLEDKLKKRSHYKTTSLARQGQFGKLK